MLKESGKTMHQNMKFIAIVVILSTFFAMFQTSMFSNAASNTQTVKIGRITPFSSDILSSNAISSVALSDINKYMVDFNHRYRFESTILDSNGTDANHLQKLQELHSQGIHIVLGGDTDSMAESSLNFVNANDILLLSTKSTSDSLAIEGDNLFRLKAPEAYTGKNIARMIWSYGVKYVCVLQRDNTWANNVYADFDLEWRALGGSYTGPAVKYPADAVLYKNYLDESEKQLATASTLFTVSKIGLLVLTGDEIITISRQVSGRPYLLSVTWFSADNMAKNDKIIINKNYDTALFHIYSPLEAFEPTLRYDDFALKFTQMTGKNMKDEYALEYDWYWMVALTILKSGSSDPALIKSNLSSIAANYVGARGRCELDTSGDLANPIYSIWGYRRVNDALISFREGWIESPPQVYWESKEKPSIDIALLADPLEVRGGYSLNFKGSVTPIKTNTDVSIKLWDPDNNELRVVAKTDAYGKILTTYAPIKPGVWLYQAFLNSDIVNRASSSKIGYFTVERTLTNISVNASPLKLLKDESIKIDGSITPYKVGATIQIISKDPDGIELKSSITSDAKGIFTTSQQMNKAGLWTIQASYIGDNFYLPSESTPFEVTVEKKPSQINALLSSDSVVEGSEVSVYGQIIPTLQSKQITIVSIAPDGSKNNQTSNTASDGRYSITLNPTKIGVWVFKAYFQSDDTYLSSTSESIALTVTRLPPKADVKLYVKDSQVKPLAGVTVTSTTQPTGQVTVSGITNADGSLSFNGVIPGSYSFFAALKGYQSSSASIDAKGSQTTDVTIILSKIEEPKNQGIPGYPAETVVTGILASIGIIFILNRKKAE